MKTLSMQQRWEAQHLRHRRWAAVVGVMIGSVVVSLVTVLFDSASQMPWLAPTPANLQWMARCDQVLGTAARHHCVEDAVASALAAASDVQVADLYRAEVHRADGGQADSPASSLAQ